MARETWTEERLDDLNTKVEKGFDEVKGEIGELRTETRTEFRELRAEMNSRFDAGQKTMILGFASIVASIAGSVIGGLIVTQL